MANFYPTVKRGFVDTPDGQVHYRAAGVAGGDALPLICLHQSPSSSLTYQEVLPLLGETRRVIALDTPGFGESFRPEQKPTIEDYAEWLFAAVAALGIERFDLMGMFTGAGTAVAIATRHAEAVRRLVLLGPPLFTPEEQERYLAGSWPARPRPDGSHLMEEWNRVMSRSVPGVPFERRVDAFQEFWRGGADSIWGEEAISIFPLRDKLPRIRQPVLVVKADRLLGHAAEAAALIPDARLVNLDGVIAWSMIQLAPDRVNDAVTGFLDTGEP